MSRDDEAARQAAADRWAARRALHPSTPSERAEFAAWMADPHNTAAYARSDRGLATLEGRRRPAPVRRGRIAGWTAVAAGLGGVAVFGAVVLTAPVGGASPWTQARPPATLRLYATRTGEERRIRLDDGTVVELDTDSVLEAAYAPDRRDVRLLRGRAFFHVAKNRRRPFVVTAADRTVTAVGTAFQVRLDPARVSVALVEGRVAVEPATDGPARLASLLRRRLLTPGQLWTESGGRVSVRTADLVEATSWRTGRLVFRDEPLGSAVAELNRYSARKLVAEGRAAELRVSGVFDAGAPDAFVAAATTLFPVHAEAAGPTETRLVVTDR